MRKIVPRYAYLPLLLVFAANTIAYFFSKPFINISTAYDFTLPIDDVIPFVPFFIVFYVLAYLQWTVNYICIARESRAFCNKFVTADIVAKIFCFVIFVAVPTTMARPAVGEGIFESLVSLIYTLDAPTNLFPSVHCLESWVVLRSAISMKTVSPWYKVLTSILSVLVFASVVFVKQHVAIDIIAGILVFELALLLTNVFKIDRVFNLKGNKIE